MFDVFKKIPVGRFLILNKNPLAVFTKPWKDLSLTELAKFVSDLGADGIEFPVRDGFQIEPQEADVKLPQFVKLMQEFGLKVFSVASSTDEKIFAGCAEAGIPLIRIMVKIDEKIGYMETEKKVRRELEEKVIPLCEKYGIKVGIQHHYGNYICNAMGLTHLIENLDPKHIGAIWDSAHSALCGEEPELGLDIVWSHLCMVNLKNAFYLRANGPEAEVAQWKRYFTTGRQGLASWPRVMDFLKKNGYEGVICLTAEYTKEEQVERLIREDIGFIKSLL